jgi:O-antigen/teichoic acid export membrane protein
MNSFLMDIKRLARFLAGHAHWVIFGRIYTSASALLLSVVLSRSMPIDVYGQYQFYISTFFLASAFSLSSSTNILLKYAAIGHEWSYKIIFNYRLWYALLGSLALVAWGGGSSGADIWVFFALALLLPLFNCCDLFEYLLQARISFKSLNLIYIFRSTFALVVPITIFLIVGDGPITVLAYVGSISFINLAFHWRSWKSINHKKILSPALVLAVKRESLFLSLSGLASLVCVHLDRVLIFNQLDPRSLAIYANGMIVGMSINALFKTVLGTVNGRLAFVKIEPWHYLVVLAFGSVLGLAGAFFMPVIITVLFGAKFSGSAIFSQVVLVSLGLYLLSNILYDNIIFGKESRIEAIYLNNVLVSIGQFLSLLAVFYIFSGSEHLLIMFAFLYPWKAFLSIVALVSSKWILNRG